MNPVTPEVQAALDMDGPLPKDLCLWWQEWLPRMNSIPDLFMSPLHPLQRIREMQWMHRRAASIQPRVVMEIGADKGGSVWAWAHALPDVERLIASEIRGTPYVPLLCEATGREILGLNGSSYDPRSVESVRKWLAGDRIDVLFIDGDKSLFDVDFDAYLPLMNPEGLVFFHDINDRPPKFSYDAVCARGYRHGEHIDTTESWEAVARAEQGLPIDSGYEGWLRHWRGASCGVGLVYLSGKGR